MNLLGLFKLKEPFYEVQKGRFSYKRTKKIPIKPKENFQRFKREESHERTKKVLFRTFVPYRAVQFKNVFFLYTTK